MLRFIEPGKNPYLLLIIPILIATTILSPPFADGLQDPPFDRMVISYPAGNGAGTTIYIPMVINLDPQETIFGYEWSSIALNHGVDLMAAANSSFVRRAAVWWPDVEPTKGTYNWATLSGIEQELLLARSRDMKVILVVRGTPDWAQADPPYDKL